MPGRMCGSKFMTDPQVRSYALAYLLKGKMDPTYAADEFEPMLGLLSLRFEREFCSRGTNEAGLHLGRLRLRVMKARPRLWLAWRTSCSVATMSCALPRRSPHVRAHDSTLSDSTQTNA